VLTRIEWAQQVGQKMPEGFDSAAIAEMGLGAVLQPATKTAMAQAESQSDALALLLCSPEFQRR